jgi:hypothetical protein
LLEHCGRKKEKNKERSRKPLRGKAYSCFFAWENGLRVKEKVAADNQI